MAKDRRIEHIVIMGDSLSDRGLMNERELLGFVPMDVLSGLDGKSPKGSFANGYAWPDHFSAMVASGFITREFTKKGLSTTDISEAIITGDDEIGETIDAAYALDKSARRIKFNGEQFVRTYAEGGLTSFSYRSKFTLNISRLISRKILASQQEKREQLLKDDEERCVTPKQKQNTLVIEWSGANDFITVNEKPTHKIVDRAIAARIENVEKLLQSGYREFVLFDLPDLALTPRFQKKEQADRDNASECCGYFNKQLAEKCSELEAKYKALYPNFKLQIFEVSNVFKDAYDNPEKYGLEKSKQTIAYNDSEDFKSDEKNQTSAASGYMFSDDIHPTADVHAVLAEKLFSKLDPLYDFRADPDTALEQFRYLYATIVDDYKPSMFSSERPKLSNYRNATLEQIFNHALDKRIRNSFTRETLQELGWLNKKGALTTTNPELLHAYKSACLALKLFPETKLATNDAEGAQPRPMEAPF